jgi:2-polyprenyl-3-methyl-5-hydroxy-6-metoxy-1,4-benzoquinol methylase
MNIFKRIKYCRICASKNLKAIIDLGKQNIQGAFVKKGYPKPYLRKIPLKLVLCTQCSLVQLQHTVNPKILYKNYWYMSGINKTMRNHLKAIVNNSLKIIKKNKLRKVLDIGCNDGTLLRNYPAHFHKVGIDPSQIIETINNKNKMRNFNFFKNFFPFKNFITKYKKNKFDIITSIAMFYDLENPNIFAKNIKEILKPDGIWIIEMSYLPEMLKTHSFDTICHEHLEYYSLKALNYLMNQNGMYIFKIEFNSINGGSIRCYIKHQECLLYDNTKYQKKIFNYLNKEKKDKIYQVSTYLDFNKKINLLKNKIKKFLNKIKKQKKSIHIYGASTKGNTIIQFLNICNKQIPYAAERNPIKWGAKTLGSNIKIISEQDSKVLKPDYYFVLPWHFKKEILNREKKILGTVKFIFPLPNFQIY